MLRQEGAALLKKSVDVYPRNQIIRRLIASLGLIVPKQKEIFGPEYGNFKEYLYDDTAFMLPSVKIRLLSEAKSKISSADQKLLRRALEDSRKSIEVESDQAGKLFSTEKPGPVIPNDQLFEKPDVVTFVKSTPATTTKTANPSPAKPASTVQAPVKNHGVEGSPPKKVEKDKKDMTKAIPPPDGFTSLDSPPASLQELFKKPETETAHESASAAPMIEVHQRGQFLKKLMVRFDWTKEDLKRLLGHRYNHFKHCLNDDYKTIDPSAIKLILWVAKNRISAEDWELLKTLLRERSSMALRRDRWKKLFLKMDPSLPKPKRVSKPDFPEVAKEVPVPPALAEHLKNQGQKQLKRETGHIGIIFEALEKFVKVIPPEAGVKILLNLLRKQGEKPDDKTLSDFNLGVAIGKLSGGRKQRHGGRNRRFVKMHHCLVDRGAGECQ